MFQLGCSSVVYRKIGLEDALHRVKSHGFHAIDICMLFPSFCPHFDPQVASEEDKKELKDLLEGMEFRVSALNVHRGALNKVQEQNKEVAFIKRCLDMAEYLGAYTVTIQSGVPVPAGEWLNTAKSMAKRFQKLASYAQDRGQELTVEIHKQAFIEKPRQALDFFHIVDAENTGVAFDPAHLTAVGVDPVEAVGELKDLIRHVHLKDAQGKNIHYSIGDGAVRFSELFQELKRIGYDRVGVLEIEPESDNLADIDREIERSKDFLMQFFELRDERLIIRQ